MPIQLCKWGNSLAIRLPTALIRQTGWQVNDQVVATCIQGIHTPLMGAALMSEYEDVLGRDELFERSRLAPQERQELLEIFFASCRWVRIYFGWRPNLRDEADNHLFELAVAGSASTIISRNLKDLQSGELRFDGVQIQTPEQFMKEHHP